MKKDKTKRISVGDAIASLIRGEYDKPIIASGSARTKSVLRGLEALRISICAARNTLEDEIKQQRVNIASVAHDLKTPLAIISGYAECLQDGMDDKDYLSLIAAKTEEMNGQVVALVEATRRDVESSALIKGESIPADFLKSEAEKYRKLAEDKKLEYKVKNAPNLKVFATRESLSKILQNLVSNAIKYSSEFGKITISFSKTSHFLIMTVADRGIGIEKNDQKHVFEQFYMSDKARTNTASSGLGLYITKQNVEELGGKITLKSKPGEWSKFSVFLPLDETGKISGLKTEKIDKLRRGEKLVLWFFLGMILTFVYRFLKYTETRNTSTLIGGLLLMPFFAFGWIMDMLEIAVSGKLSYFLG